MPNDPQRWAVRPGTPPRCGAKTRSGTPCRTAAGAGTDHFGVGLCWRHGGRTKAHRTRAHRIQQSSAYQNQLEEPRLRALFEHFKAQADPTDILDELALLRSLTLDYINRAEALETALLRWSGSFNRDYQEILHDHINDIQDAQATEDWPRYAELLEKLPDPKDFNARPRKVMDLADAHKLILAISTVIDRLERQRDAGSIPVKTLMVFFGDIANVAVSTARDAISSPIERAAFLARLSTAWEQLRIGREPDAHDETPSGNITSRVN